MTTSASPQQILQSIMAQMAQRNQGQPQPGIPGMSGLPGQAPPQGQQGMVPGASMPQQPLPPGSPRPSQAGIPGAAQPQTGSPGVGSSLPPVMAPNRSQLPQGKNVAGLVLGLVNSHQQKDHDKKAALASGYYTQISDLLATDPNTPEGKKSHEQAQLIMDDPKIRKMLYEGLNWKPLEEEPPPEAVGVHSAMQKQQAKDQKKQPWMPQGKAIMPPPSQAAQQASQLAQQKVATEQAAAEEHRAVGEAATSNAETERLKMGPERVRAYAQADEALGHAKWYKQQVKESENLTPTKKAGLQAGQNLANSRADFYGHLGKYYDKMPEGKLSGSLLREDLASTGKAMNEMLKGFIKDNQAAAAAVSKDTGYFYGPKEELTKKQQETKKLADKMRQGMAYFYGEGKQKVLSGEMTVPEAAAEAYRLAGVTPPDAPDEAGWPERPEGVPDDAVWDSDTQTWGVQ